MENSQEFVIGATVKVRGIERKLTLLGTTGSNKDQLFVAKALCSEKDKFSRHRAKEICRYRLGNLKKQKFYIFNGDFSTLASVYKAMHSLKEDIVKHPEKHFKPYGKH